MPFNEVIYLLLGKSQDSFGLEVKKLIPGLCHLIFKSRHAVIYQAIKPNSTLLIRFHTKFETTSSSKDAIHGKGVTQLQ